MNMNKDFNIQNQFLNRVRKSKIVVTAHINDGRIFQGVITAFDNYSLLLKDKNSSTPILVFKHALLYIEAVDKGNELLGIGEEI